MIYRQLLNDYDHELPNVMVGDILITSDPILTKAFRVVSGHISCKRCPLQTNKTYFGEHRVSYCASMYHHCFSTRDNYHWEEITADQLMEDVL